MEILSNRISATPRSKYVRYGYGDTYISGSGNSGSANVDLSNYVKLTGETEQTIEGNVLATGDLIAYATGQSTENYPIASSTALGMIKVGKNLTIDEDGTLNAQAGGEGGVSSWNDLTDKPELLTDENIQKWNDNSHTHTNKAILDTITADSIHTHANKSYLDSINQNLSTTSDVNFNSVKAVGDIVAYSTGQSTVNFPIASTTALGCIKVGNNLTISSDGTLSATGGGGSGAWSDITGKPTTLAGYGITDGVTTSSFNSHTSSSAHITSTERSNWNIAYNNSHSHSNYSVLDGITSSNISNWNTAYNNAHSHSNKSYLDNINQNLSKSSTPTFSGGLVTGDTSGLNIQHSSGNSINGRNSSSMANLYFNYSSASKNVLVDADCNVKAYGDVIAYSTGTASAPFKYWYPSVDSKGNLSWTNSTSTTTPSSVNIKGAKGDKGDTGKSVGKVSAYSTSSASGGSSVYRVYDEKDTVLGSFTVYNGAKGEKGDTGPQGPKGATGDASSLLATLAKGTDRTIIRPATYPNGGYLGAFGGRPGDAWQYFFVTNASEAAIGWIKESGSSNVAVIKATRSSSTVNVTAPNGSFSNGSDARRKNIISECDIKLDDIAQIKNYHFRWKGEDDTAPIKCGVMAQDLLENDKFKPFVGSNTDENGDEFYNVNYAGLGVAIASNGIKQLYDIVKQQQAKIDELEQRLAIIESKNNEL